MSTYAFLAAQSSGSVSGLITDEQGKPATGVIIFARMVDDTFIARSTTGKDGRFAIPGLRAGQYLLCASPAETPFLDTCLWQRTKHPFTIKGSETVTSDLRLPQAGTLRVTLADTSGLIEAAAKGPQKGAPLLLAGVVSDDHLFIPLTRSSGASKITTYQIKVPMDIDLKLSLHGSPVRLQGEGKIVDARSADTFQVRVDKAGGSLKEVAINVLPALK